MFNEFKNLFNFIQKISIKKGLANKKNIHTQNLHLEDFEKILKEFKQAINHLNKIKANTSLEEYILELIIARAKICDIEVHINYFINFVSDFMQKI